MALIELGQIGEAPGPLLRGSHSAEVSLLALGIPDGAIAKRPRISERTVGRRIKELADSLGVDTRFQIGVEAARRGLI